MSQKKQKWQNDKVQETEEKIHLGTRKYKNGKRQIEKCDERVKKIVWIFVPGIFGETQR